MKKIIITLVTATVVILFFFTGCDRTPKDFREQWVGDWDFETKIRAWEDDIGVWYDTIYYLGKISIGSKNDELLVKYMERDSAFLNIEEDGTIIKITKAYWYGSSLWGKHDGYFDGYEKIHLFISDGGLGGGIFHNIDGIKKKGVKRTKGGKNE